MDKIFLIASIVLFVLAIKSHALTKANVITKIEKQWYERLFTGSRPAKDNLTAEGLEHRKQSNLYTTAGMITLGIYVWLNAAAH